MTQYLQVDAATGRILRGVGRRDPASYAGAPEPQRPFPHDGTVYHAWQGRIEFSAHPTPTCELRWVDGEPRWVDVATLDDAQALAWERVKQARDEAEAGVFRFDGDLYDINKENINGAAVMALMAQLAGEPFAVAWTLADNTVKTLDGATVQRLGRALVVHIDGLHATGRELRARISAATTPAEAYAVTWPIEELSYVEPDPPAV